MHIHKYVQFSFLKHILHITTHTAYSPHCTPRRGQLTGREESWQPCPATNKITYTRTHSGLSTGFNKETTNSTLTHTCTYAHVLTHMYLHTCTYAHVHTHTYLRTCTYTHVLTHMYLHTYIYTHVSKTM